MQHWSTFLDSEPGRRAAAPHAPPARAARPVSWQAFLDEAPTRVAALLDSPPRVTLEQQAATAAEAASPPVDGGTICDSDDLSPTSVVMSDEDVGMDVGVATCVSYLPTTDDATADGLPSSPPVPLPLWLPPGAQSVTDGEAADWAFSVSDSAADALPAEQKKTWDLVRLQCKLVDNAAVMTSAAKGAEVPDPTIRHQAIPRRTRRQLRTIARRVMGDGAASAPAHASESAAAKAITQALQWDHPGSLQARLNEMSLEGRSAFMGDRKRALEAFEPEGVIQRLRYVSAFLAWAEAHGVTKPSAAAASDVDQFLAIGKTGSPGYPLSVYNALVWAGRYLYLGVDVRGAAKPRLQRPPGAKEDFQARPVPPELVRRIDSLWPTLDSDHDRWAKMAVAAALMMTSSWLRYRHLCRAYPTELTSQLLWLYITRDKCRDASGIRHGFRSAVPRFSALGFDVGDFIWTRWHFWACRSDNPSPGLFRDEAGRVMSRVNFVRSVQKVVAAHRLVEDPSLITSYSWRRATDGLAEARRADPFSIASMGGWRPKAGAGSSSAPSIPMLYAGDRLKSAGVLRVHHVHILRAVFTEFPASANLSWDAFRAEAAKCDSEAIYRSVCQLFTQEVQCKMLKPGVVPGLRPQREIVSVGGASTSRYIVNEPAAAVETLPAAQADAGDGQDDRACVLLDSAWVIPLSCRGRLHISTLETCRDPQPKWRCSPKATKVFRNPAGRGIGIREGVTLAQLRGRMPCADCLSTLTGEAADLLREIQR